MLCARSGKINMSIEKNILNESAVDSDRDELEDILFSLGAARKLQRDKRTLGVDRVDSYYKNAEGDWLENWQEEVLDESEQGKK